jgi:hypothetical protein
LTTFAWWHCFAGIAGDMALASLVDAGADMDEVVAGLEKLPVTGWHVEAVPSRRSGLAATQLRVEVSPDEEATERTWGTIRGLLEAAELPERVRRRAQKVFACLALAEGRLHGVSPEEVHFHEVGGVDAIVDIVGTCLALELLGVDSVRASPVAVGLGTVRSAHGLLPNPAPAVVELLSGVPVHGTDHDVELTTPTGAALLAALATSFGPLPPMTLRASGYGAGTREIPGLPNVLQVLIGELEPPAESVIGTHQDLVLLEANVDDVSGEVLAHTLGALMGEGALDAWLVPVLGKKGRPGHVVSALAEAQAMSRLARSLVSETGTLGFRVRHVDRWAVARQVLEVEVGGSRVRVKAGPYRLKAEYDDCAAVAAALGLPVREVASRAEQAAAAAQRASTVEPSTVGPSTVGPSTVEPSTVEPSTVE